MDWVSPDDDDGRKRKAVSPLRGPMNPPFSFQGWSVDGWNSQSDCSRVWIHGSRACVRRPSTPH